MHVSFGGNRGPRPANFDGHLGPVVETNNVEEVVANTLLPEQFIERLEANIGEWKTMPESYRCMTCGTFFLVITVFEQISPQFADGAWWRTHRFMYTAGD